MHKNIIGIRVEIENGLGHSEWIGDVDKIVLACNHNVDVMTKDGDYLFTVFVDDAKGRTLARRIRAKENAQASGYLNRKGGR